MKSLDEYFLMAVFMSLVNRIRVFVNVVFNLNREAVKGLIAGAVGDSSSG